MSRRETMERKEKAGHARQHGGDQEPFSPAIETFAHEQSEQNHKTGEDSDKADQRMNYCINVQYHDLPITSTFARTVTSRFVAIAPLALGRCPGTGVACWSESSGLATEEFRVGHADENLPARSSLELQERRENEGPLARHPSFLNPSGD